MIKHKLSLHTFNLSRSICMVLMLLLLQSTFLAFSTVRAASLDGDDDKDCAVNWQLVRPALTGRTVALQPDGIVDGRVRHAIQPPRGCRD